MARKPVSTTIEEKILKDAKKLAIDYDCSLNDLIEEALLDLFKKYDKDSLKK